MERSDATLRTDDPSRRMPIQAHILKALFDGSFGLQCLREDFPHGASILSHIFGKARMNRNGRGPEPRREQQEEVAISIAGARISCAPASVQRSLVRSIRRIDVERSRCPVADIDL